MSTQRIAVAVDGSEANEAALEWAVMHASAQAAHLVVATVAEPYQVVGAYAPEQPPEEYLKPVASAAVQRAAQTLPIDSVSATIRPGHPVPVLQQVAADHDLLVLGKRGMGAIGRLLVGSTSIAVAGRAHAPVVVVPVDWDAQSRLDTPVVVGVDVDKDHVDALRFAFSVAQQRGVSLRAVQAWEPHPALVAESAAFLQSFDDWMAEVGAELRTRLAAMAEEFPGVEAQVVQVIGQPARHLLDEAADAQLLVLGRDAKDRLSGFALGSVARQVLHHSEVPVVVVPVPSAGDPAP